ncbi:MAG: hypothetical protein ACU84H_14955 [Gammaproteobacteria bacterium]
MKKRCSLVMFIIICFLSAKASVASEHHSGHGAMTGGGGGRSSCSKPRLDRFAPAPLATVSPGAEFSFYAFNIDDPKNIAVTAKQIPVEVTSEYREPFYIIKGKLPDSLKNTSVRINIQVSSKYARCEAEKGWLIKVSE